MHLAIYRGSCICLSYRFQLLGKPPSDQGNVCLGHPAIGLIQTHRKSLIQDDLNISPSKTKLFNGLNVHQACEFSTGSMEYDASTILEFKTFLDTQDRTSLSTLSVPQTTVPTLLLSAPGQTTSNLLLRGHRATKSYPY